jgi:hypothetical protein
MKARINKPLPMNALLWSAAVSSSTSRSTHGSASALRLVPPRPHTAALQFGGRERWSASRENLNGIRFADTLARILPLPFGSGEGRGEGKSE